MSAADGLSRKEEDGSANLPTLTIFQGDEWRVACEIRLPKRHFSSLATRHLPLLRKAGRYKLAAPVSKTGSVHTEVGALPTPSANLKPKRKEVIMIIVYVDVL